ncbi:MAG: hypothetical protein Q7T82_19550 [Armatimonadota bacterium]|nr:hypothetical protein [Armatimonadota bacterium]
MEIQHFEFILRSPSGYPTQSPRLAILNTTLEQMKVFSTEFRLTPISRPRQDRESKAAQFCSAISLDGPKKPVDDGVLPRMR